MSCDICGRSSCANWMHSAEQIDRYSDVIEAVDKARELRKLLEEEEEEEEAEYEY